MGSLTCAEMQLLEGRAFVQGATPEGLMEKAGKSIAWAILRRYPVPGVAIACVGSGNNGGDALVALRYLAKEGWKISIRCLHASSNIGSLPRKKWRELGDCQVNAPLSEFENWKPLVLLDGLLGIGANGPLRSPLDELASWMNHARKAYAADIIAMDIPSGVNGDTGEVYDGAVEADLTLTVGVPKSGLFAESAVNHVGGMELIPLDELPVPDHHDASYNTCPYLNDVHSLRGILPRRPHDFHKGNAGRVGILAGSRGMLGAAVLCARGALHGGAGLVTLFTHESIYSLLAPMLPAEVMLMPIKSLEEIENVHLDTLAVGPGLGSGAEEGRGWGAESMLALLDGTNLPMIVDADALNWIAAAGGGKHIRANMLLTPHPGEMKRLFPESATMSRMEAGRAFTDGYPGAVLLLKGARSLITSSGSPAYINGTGNAGMACGGQGDILTGVAAAVVAQGVNRLDAARLASWLCGRAAELAMSHGGASYQSLTAGVVSEWLGSAFRELRS